MTSHSGLRKAWVPIAMGTLFTAALLAADRARAEAGHGHWAVTYQYITIDGFASTIGELDIGTTDTHVLNFEVDYAVTDRWSVSAGIPLIRKRYNGPVPHVPSSINPPQDGEFIDDGDYHTDFQDIHLGVRYRAKEGPLTIEPFVALGVPSNDYAFFGHAAVGQNLWKVDVGSHFTYVPPFSDFFYTGELSRVFVEETLGVSIDHWRLNLAAGYFFSPQVSGRVFILGKEGDGLDFPDDFPPPRDTAFWYQHDRMVRHNYVHAGIGADWIFTPGQRLALSAFTEVHSDQVHILDYAVSLTYSRSF